MLVATVFIPTHLLQWLFCFVCRERFKLDIPIPMPDKAARRVQILHMLEDLSFLSPNDIEEVVDMTDGFSGRQIVGLGEAAANVADR